MQKQLFIIILFLILNIMSRISIADEKIFSNFSNDPCAGPSALLALLNRPTIQDSACVVKPNHMIIELGSQYASLRGGGHGYNLPETEIRYGLPFNNEFVLSAPNFFHQNISGWGSTLIGIKHEIAYTNRWILATEGLLTLPSGSAAFGSPGLGTAINGIAELELTPSIAFTVMLGVSSQTLSSSAGGQRYTSVNPDIVLTWLANKKLQFFGEIYGQTKTAPSQGPGYNINGGVQYLITPDFEIDAAEGVRLAGNLGGFTQVFGIGAGLAF